MPIQVPGKFQGESVVTTRLWHEQENGNSGLNEKNQVTVYRLASACFSCHLAGSRENNYSLSYTGQESAFLGPGELRTIMNSAN